MSSDDRVVLRTNFGDINLCRRPLVKDGAGVGASEHK